MATTKVKVRQVVGDGVYDCELKGISADQIDSTTVNAIFRYNRYKPLSVFKIEVVS